MLFTAKRRPVPSLLLALLLAALSLVAAQALNLSWSLAVPERAPLLVALGLVAVAASDALLHGLLWLLWREVYLHNYARLVSYFAGQSVAAILAGGLLAAAEELFFRGLLVAGIIERLQWGPAAALVIASALFMLLHLILQPGLGMFGLWAFWESMLLGLVFVMSGSLFVVLLVHAAHDIAGFGLFALQRRNGWLLPEDAPVPANGVGQR